MIAILALLGGCEPSPEERTREIGFLFGYPKFDSTMVNSETQELTLPLLEISPEECIFAELFDTAWASSDPDEDFIGLRINTGTVAHLRIKNQEGKSESVVLTELIESPAQLGFLSLNPGETTATLTPDSFEAAVQTENWNTVNFTCDPKFGYGLYLTGKLTDEHRDFTSGSAEVVMFIDAEYEGRVDDNYAESD